MLDVGSFRTKTCGGVGRRAFLRLATSVPMALGASAAVASANPPTARARSVLFVFLWGAPSHLDTLDPKPDAPAEYRGPFGTIPTRTPGLRFTELLPQLAQQSHLFTMVRTHVTSESGHPEAGTVALSGFSERAGPVQPNFGAVVGKHRGPGGRLPAFVSLANGVPADASRRIEGHGGGTLTAANDPMMVGCSETGKANIAALQLLPGLTPAQIVDRRTLSGRLDRAARGLSGPAPENWGRREQAAHQLLTNPESRAAFDLSRETPATRARYGQSEFGQSCLLGRRLVEAGVPYVQVNYSQHVEAMNPGYEHGWDTHLYNFELHQDLHCPVFDRAFSALLADLADRGLLDTTLVVCMGEFGRTPRISKGGARDHWPNCYPSVWAGAGIAGGRVLGQSDRRGQEPAVGRPLPPLLVGTTIAELAGVDAQRRAELRVLDGGSVIHELL
ncbi:MAG: DUF1501 domain-containing protein [Gemmataceae bacterium]|nr:DUF1501 domain-containing protein [Gemmataceae bacterium]